MGRYLELLQERRAQAVKKVPEENCALMRGNSAEQKFGGIGTPDYRAYRATAQVPPLDLSPDTLDKKANEINDEYHITGEVLPRPLSDQIPPLRGCAIIRGNSLEAAFEAFAECDRNKALNRRYTQAFLDAKAFLSTWADQAEALGWTPNDLFGLDPVAPLARYDAMGLVWMLHGARVIALTASAAVIREATGSMLSYYRRMGR